MSYTFSKPIRISYPFNPNKSHGDFYKVSNVDSSPVSFVTKEPCRFLSNSFDFNDNEVSYIGLVDAVPENVEEVMIAYNRKYVSDIEDYQPRWSKYSTLHVDQGRSITIGENGRLIDLADCVDRTGPTRTVVDVLGVFVSDQTYAIPYLRISTLQYLKDELDLHEMLLSTPFGSLKNILYRCEAWLTGSYPLSLLHGEEHTTDIDIFCPVHNVVTLIGHIVREGGTFAGDQTIPKGDSYGNDITRIVAVTDLIWNGMDIQIVSVDIEDVSAHIAEVFDFSFCTLRWNGREVLPENLTDIRKKVGTFNLSSNASRDRWTKYQSRGYTITL
jgi:hypothetical protein